MWGVVGAVGARIILIFFALQLLALPYLKAVGALLLLWIGVKLMLPEDDEGHGKLEGGSTLWSAVRTVIVADAVMSLDNVIAVAAAADGHLGLVVFGILVSVPIIVWGSKFVLMLIDRFPLVVVFGAALLGWIAGGMLVGDVAWKGWLEAQPGWTERAASAAGAAFVVLVGKLLVWRRRRPLPAAPVGAAAAPAALRRILVASDGSPGAAQALRQALALRGQLREGAQAELHLVNVQRPVSGNVSSFVAAGSIEDYHRERVRAGAGRARARRCSEAGVPFQEHRRVGEPGREHRGDGRRTRLRPDRDGLARPGHAHRRAARLGGRRDARACRRAGARGARLTAAPAACRRNDGASARGRPRACCGPGAPAARGRGDRPGGFAELALRGRASGRRPAAPAYSPQSLGEHRWPRGDSRWSSQARAASGCGALRATKATREATSV